MRAFIGIDFNKEMKERMFELQQRLKKHAIRGRWKSIDNFHLTLKFLDEIDAKQRLQIEEALSAAVPAHSPFELKIGELGIFKGREDIRVLWLGLSGDTERLNLLQKDVDKAMDKVGFPSEKRPFTPHITLGQDILFDCSFEKIKNEIAISAGHELKVKNADTTKVDRIHLFKSEQIQSKRVYTKVTGFDLNIGNIR